MTTAAHYTEEGEHVPGSLRRVEAELEAMLAALERIARSAEARCDDGYPAFAALGIPVARGFDAE